MVDIVERRKYFYHGNMVLLKNRSQATAAIFAGKFLNGLGIKFPIKI